MLVKNISALAALAFATHVVAELMPYKPQLMKMSSRQLFGRTEKPGYQPEPAVCGSGDTCEEACGAEYVPCASQDDDIHCFRPGAGELCCPNLSGDSCDAGYYCTSDKDNETWCCPEGMDLTACAAAYGVDGGLVQQTPKPTSSAPPSSSSAPAISSSSWGTNSTITSAASSTSEPSSAPTLSVNTTRITGTSTPKPTDIQQGAGNLVAPASAFALVIAGFAALL